MNMPEPMNSDNYDNVSRTMKDATQIVAESSMFDTAKELKGGATEIVDASVSIDATWQKRGFVLSLGVVAAIGVETGKILDMTIMSKSCKGCTQISLHSLNKK